MWPWKDMLINKKHIKYENKALNTEAYIQRILDYSWLILTYQFLRQFETAFQNHQLLQHLHHLDLKQGRKQSWAGVVVDTGVAKHQNLREQPSWWLTR